MHDPARDYMILLAEGAQAEEAYADYFAVLAAKVRDTGDVAQADVMTGHARQHRVKGIEMRAQLGALVEQWGALHLDGER